MAKKKKKKSKAKTAGRGAKAKKAAGKGKKKASKKKVTKAKSKKKPAKKKTTTAKKPKAAARKSTAKKTKPKAKAKKRKAAAPVAEVTQPAPAGASETGEGYQPATSSDDAEGDAGEDGGPRLGELAPAFARPAINHRGEELDLTEFLGKKNIVLYFYPKDDTPGCTKEACSFQDGMAEFAKFDTVVVGVSGDGVESHRRFANKYQLQFPLLADTDHALAKAYGVYGKKNMYGREYMGVKRSTFLIGKDGRIAKSWANVKVAGHSDEVLKALSGK